MPELPEVETVRRGLEPRLAGRVIERAEILDGRLTAPDDPIMIGMELDGDRVVSIGRRGKYLLIMLESGRTLVVHLRMTGWFHHQAGGAPRDRRAPSPRPGGAGRRCALALFRPAPVRHHEDHRTGWS